MSHSIFLTRRAALRGLAGGSAVLALGVSSAALAESTITPQTVSAVAGRRQIGFDLWSGVPGSRFGQRIDKTVGSRNISGPNNWRHPITGENLTIYVRRNRERNGGVRIRYLTMNADGTALARVFDRRPGQQHDRYFVGDAFVPMGVWGDDTRRRYTMTQYQNGRSKRFRIQLRMRRPDFTFEGRTGSMQYDWIATTPTGRKVFHERFVYSPGIGFADFDNRL